MESPRRLASIAERKKLLGLCNESNIPQVIAASPKASPGLPGNCITKRNSSSPPPRTPPPLKKPKPKIPVVKKRKMTDKPPVAPKSDIVKNLPPASRAKRRPPPPKPLPYRQHRENKDKEITTFRPVQPVTSRPLPDVPPLKPPRRLSSKGEPAPEFYHPSTQVQPPIEYTIPEIPPNVPLPIDSRPRLITPICPPQPPISNGVSQTVHVVPVFSESEVTPAPVLKGEMYTEAYSHVSQQLEVEEEYSTVREVAERRHHSPLRKSPPPSLLSPLAENEYNVTSHHVRSKRSPSPSPQPPPTTLEEEYSLLDRPGKPVRAVSPQPPGRGNEYNVTSHHVRSKRSPSPSPQPPPTTLEEEYSLLDRPGKPVRAVSPQPPGRGNEYNVTSHHVRSKRSPSPSPQPPPTTLEEEYSVLDRSGKPVRAVSPQPPGRGNEYSELDIPSDEGEPVVVQPLLQQEGYGKLEFSSLPVEPEEWKEDGYDVIRHDRPRTGPAEVTPVKSPQQSPKAKARRVSLKIKAGKVKLASSRDRSILPAYQNDASSVPLKPKRHSANSDSDTQVAGYEPPVTPVDDTALEEAGYETFNTFSPPPNSEAPAAPWKQEEDMKAKSPVQVQLSPKIEIDIDQLLIANVNSSPFRKAAPVDGLYGKVIDVDAQKVGSDTEYENEASVASLNQGDHDIGPTPVVVKKNVASSKLQPGDLKTVRCFGIMDTLGYCEIDVDPPKPKPRTRRKPSTCADEDTKEASQGGSSDPNDDQVQEQKVLGYVAMDVIQARKEQYKNEKGSEEGEEKPRKSLAPPRRRPPPPPPPVSAPVAVLPPPHPYSPDEIKTHIPKPASKRLESPKFEKSGRFSRVKSRSIHGTKPSVKSPTEDYDMEKSFEKSGPVSHSPGLGKKLKGLFKLSSSGDAVPEGKQGGSKWKKGKEHALTPDLSGSRKTMTLPAGNRRKHSYDAVDEHGAFSMVSDPSPEGDDDGVLLDEGAYTMIDIQDVKKRPTKQGNRGFEMRKSVSVEHLYEDAEFGDRRSASRRRGDESRSASNSPQVIRRSPGRDALPLPHYPPSFHLATLPRRKPGEPPVDLTQLYATVSKPEEPLRRPRKKKHRERENKEVRKSPDLGPTISPLVSDVSHGEPPADEIPSSEIPHTVASDGQIYAEIHPRIKQKKGSVEEVTTSVESQEQLGQNGEARGVEPEAQRTPPPKPKRGIKAAPPKPPPYYRESYTGPIPPQNNNNNTAKQVVMTDKSTTLEDVKGPPIFPPPHPPSSLPESPLRIAIMAAPLSPAPPLPTPPPGDDHTYEIPADVLETIKAKHREDVPVVHVDPSSPSPQEQEKEGPPEELVLVDESSQPDPIQRAPHFYEVVPEEFAAKSVAVPMRQHQYELVPDDDSPKGHRRKSQKRRSDFPQLRPKTKPPPAPPSTKPKPVHTALPPITRQSSVPEASLPVDSFLGKKIHVEVRSDEHLGEGGEPTFLFPKSHSQNFILVGDAEATTSPSLSCSTLSTFDDDSDNAYSTEWDTSSEEEDDEREQETSPSPPRPKTYYIAHEILTTERTFVKGLNLLHKDFRQTVLSANRAHEKPIIPEESLKHILGNIGSLVTLNSGLLQELEERMAQWDEDPRIGDILLARAPYLKLYTEYISRFDKALKLFDECLKKYPVFARIVHEFEAQPKCAHLPLASYLLEIVQRIPRYKLLLADYLKHLSEDSEDRGPSGKALAIISSVATHVNETIRQMDNFRKVVEVRKKLLGDTGDSLITPYRKLLKEGELLKFSRKEKQPRMFFLFNDLLIYASSIPPANTTYKVIKRIPLEGMRVERLDDPEMRFGFQIISTCKSFRLEGSTDEERQQWLKAFDTAIQGHCERVQSREKARRIYQADQDGPDTSSAPLGSLAPAWLPDSAVSMCQLCSVHFTVTRRRHHCRACGMIYCSECSSYLAPLKYKSNKLGRVCQACYEKLTPVQGSGEEAEDKTPKRRTPRTRSQKLVNLPAVLREVKARDQSAQISGYLHCHTSKTKRWKKKWFVIYNLVLYEFERHEDVTAKRSITLPSYQVISPVPRHDDPFVFCLRHPGLGNKHYFKVENEEGLRRWIEVLQKAVRGETGDESPKSPQKQDFSPPPPDDITAEPEA